MAVGIVVVAVVAAGIVAVVVVVLEAIGLVGRYVVVEQRHMPRKRLRKSV